MSRLSATAVLEAVSGLAERGLWEVSSTDVVHATQGSPATIRRYLDALCASGHLARSGQARATRYRLITAEPEAVPVTAALATAPIPAWSPAAIELGRKLDVPLGARDPVTYRRE